MKAIRDNRNLYSILKANEGGMGQAAAIFLLKEAGIKAEKATSPYVGHTAITVHTANKRILKKVSRILYG